MCGLVGIAVTSWGTKFPTQQFKALMAEARIRGQHATGVAWAYDYGHRIKKDPVPEDQFDYPDLDGSQIAIGHLRYSTSDLEFNQPNAVDNMSLVHNGVVTQEPPERWEELFGVKCDTRNDSEILVRHMEKGEHPLHLVNTSQACIAINAEPEGDRSLYFWRNEQRPLYYVQFPEFIVVASTADIIHRALDVPLDQIKQCEPCRSYSFSVGDNGELHSTLVREPLEDLQNVR